MTTRLTRKEQQARTRSALLASATVVLAEKGLHRASIDDITGHAGFTKGAFYANFASKEELFLVLLDDHFAERLAAIERLTSGEGDLPTVAAQAGQDFIEALRGDQAWAKLFLEFTGHAARDEGFRVAFTARTEALRSAIARIYTRRVAQAGISLSPDPELVSRMIFAMAHGAAFDGILDRDAPADLLAQMLTLIFAGLVATASDAGPTST